MMNKFMPVLYVLTCIACLALGYLPRYQWQIHGETVCVTREGNSVSLEDKTSISLIVNQANGKSLIAYQERMLTCPTVNVWVK